jgi:hypothetical protein
MRNSLHVTILVGLVIVGCFAVILVRPEQSEAAWAVLGGSVTGGLMQAFGREVAGDAATKATADTFARLSRRPTPEEASPLVAESKGRMPMQSATGFSGLPSERDDG